MYPTTGVETRSAYFKSLLVEGDAATMKLVLSSIRALRDEPSARARIEHVKAGLGIIFFSFYVLPFVLIRLFQFHAVCFCSPHVYPMKVTFMADGISASELLVVLDGRATSSS